MSATTDDGAPPAADDAPPPPPPPPAAPALHWRTSLLLVAAFATVLLASLALLLPAPYVVMSPGPAIDVLGSEGGHPLISVRGHESYPATTKGTLDLTTVTVAGGPGSRVSVLGVLTGWFSDRQEVLPYDLVYPPGTTQQSNDSENAQEMTSSQEAAAVAALTELGIQVPTTLTVASVDDGTPPSPLRAKDVIVAVGGKPVTDLGDLTRAVQAAGPGTTLALTVRRDGRDVVVQAPTRKFSDGRTVLGVHVDPTYRTPFDVSIRIDNVGGPSAGMMFALGIVDVLTPGDLTGGQKIAGTGAIMSDGTVGAIGGIPLKMIGARDAGARWFLAPQANCTDVVGHVPSGLRVVRVATLHEAHQAVDAIAAGRAQDLPTCTK